MTGIKGVDGGQAFELEESKGQSKQHRFLLVGLISLFWGSLYVYIPILPPYVERLGGTLSEVGIVLAAYGFTQWVFRLPVGFGSDLLGRRMPFVWLGFAAAAVSGVGLYFSRLPMEAAFFRGVGGLAATTWVVQTSIFAAAWPKDQLIRAMGMAQFATSVGQLVAMWGGGILAKAYGWGAPFLAASVLALFGMLGLLGLPETPFTKKTGKGEGWRQFAGRRLLLLSLLCLIVQYAAYVTTYGFTYSHAVRIGASEMQLSYLGIASTLPVALISLMLGGSLIGKVDPRILIVTGLVVNTVAIGFIPVTVNVGLLLAVQVLCSIARALTFPVLIAEVLRGVPSARAGSTMAVAQFIYSIGMVAGPLVAGTIGDSFGFGAAFWSTAAVTGAGACLAFFLKPVDQLQPARSES